MKKLLATLCLAASVPVMANTVYTNESVDHRNSNGDLFRAFRSLSSCLNWYHMPGEFNQLDGYLTYPRMTKIKIPKAADPTTLEKATGYGFFIDTHLSAPELQNTDEEKLKEKIASFVNNIVSRNKTDKKYAHYQDCPNLVEAKDISLSRMMVRNKTDVTTLESALNSTKPNSVVHIKKPDSMDVLSDAYYPVNLNLMYDLTNPETENIYAQTFNGAQKLNVGQTRFMIYGKERVYDASLTLRGEMSAKWVSELTTVDCKKENSNSSTNLSGGVNFAGSEFMPSMASMGTPSASLGLSQKKEVTVCLQKLLTRMADANSTLKFEFELDRNVNTENKFVTECDNGECHQMKLDTWIRITLLDMWVKSNFHVISQKLADGTFDHTVRPTGETKALINTSVSLGENFIIDVDIATPIILKNVKKEYPYANSTSERLQCFWNGFYNQSFDYEIDTKSSLMPITKECLGIKD